MKPQNNKIVTSDFKLKNVRISYPHLFEARAVGDSEPRYSASFLINKDDDDQLGRLRKTINTVMRDKWGNALPSEKKAIQTCLYDGNEKDAEGYEDVFYVNASSKNKPGVFDRDRRELTADDGVPYAGCFVNAIIRLWAQDNNYGKRINAELRGVQFVRDGEPLGGSRPITADDFDDLGAEDDDKNGDGPLAF